MKFDPERRTRPRSTKITAYTILLTLLCNLLNHNPSALSVNDENPRTNNAVLALSNGTRINLCDAKSGLVLKLEGIEITKPEDGSLVYKIAGSKSDASGYSTISTPKGGQYKVILPDSTQVWLNAASSLSFKTSMKGNLGERRMKLVGEAYFEVKKDKAHPFIVMVEKQELEVIGTHFNISAYPDERSIRTTLSEGSVRISAFLSRDGCGVLRRNQVILKPSQQSILTKESFQVTNVDPEEVLAWKNGYFSSGVEPLENIMFQLAKWYNVDVVYEDKRLAHKVLGGVMSRSNKLSEVLSILEAAGDVHFKVEGRKVTVSK